MKKVFSRLTVCVVLVAIIFSVAAGLISCKKEVIDNETTRLVLSTSELEGVFNPFYSSSAADGGIVGMTQISMLGADKDGIITGKEARTSAERQAALAAEPCVVYDYDEVTYEENGKQYTRYRFVLKNNIKFSNGTPLTMKDVLFNLYEYLDPAYYGSATIYSTDIVGLKEYQTQTRNENEQKGFNKPFNDKSDDRITYLLEALDNIADEVKRSLTDSEMETKLKEYSEANGAVYKDILVDYKTAKAYFMRELESDYTNSIGTAGDIKFLDKAGREVTLSNDTEAFLYTEGKITWKEKEYRFDYSLGENSKNWDKQTAINNVYNSYVPNDMLPVLTASATANELRAYIANKLKKAYYDDLPASERITSVSGIKFANQNGEVEVNGNMYAKVEHDTTGAVKGDGHEVLEITINKVDPKAIWNFAFTVAPMYYYSNEATIAKFDYNSNFGVEFGDPDFQDEVIKASDKIGVPVGAGPYKATTQSGDGSNVIAGTFRSNGVVYFERNDYFLFPVKIKYVNYQVVSTNLMLDSLYSNAVHFVEPACKQEVINDISAKKDSGTKVDYDKVRTNGYGYIGINAEKVPSIAVRRAIMHAFNTQLCVDYYFGYSDSIYRPMTKASWAYPSAVDNLHAANSAEEDQHYYKFDGTGATSRQLIEDAGYAPSGSSKAWVNTKTNDVLKYTFTIAGESTDHPAYTAMKQAADILNANGFDITVSTDIRALSKLNNGELTVWAAAWGAAIDPDMYQVYHKDSTAGSTSNWGYRAILKNANHKYDEELRIVNKLSEKIDTAREFTENDLRAPLYADALDLVMDLAVELPTYQRSDLFAFNTAIIDASTLQRGNQLTPYNGPLARLWEVSLNETK